jgi:DNA-cytosine methyltransferase
MNVLSLFDGISAGQVALERAGIEVTNYYAAEIDKYAIKITMANYPNTIKLGDVTKWREWEIDWGGIDFVSAGFPCQSWSLAGKQLGDKDERGMLFWVTLDIISFVLQCNPKAKFMLENVKMKKEFEDYITLHTENALGVVHKTLINSARLSAQNRNRFYWTNFEVSQPEDKGIVLADILENGEADRDKSYCIDANYHKGGNPEQYFNKSRRQLVFRPCELLESETAGGHIANATDIRGHQSNKRVYNPNGKDPTLLTMGGGHREPKVLCGAIRGRYIVDGKRQDGKMLTAGLTQQMLEVKAEAKSNSLTPVQKDNVVTDLPTGSYAPPCSYRKLTPIECERLQTFPDGYTAHVSNTQRYKALGNSWTVDVIAHILRGAFYD